MRVSALLYCGLLVLGACSYSQAWPTLPLLMDAWPFTFWEEGGPRGARGAREPRRRSRGW
jgi:hypothetical protein